MAANEIIKLSEVCKSYQMGGETVHALKNINLAIDEGDFLAILGPSGSGKSTLMNIIGCMDTMDSGQYLLRGEAIQKKNDHQLTQLRNREIGFVFQKYQLIPKYTVLQNIIMPLLIRGIGHRKAVEQCSETIRLLGLEERIGHKPSELSGGQQQRVAIARALVGRPALLLCDEPTGALDSATGAEVLALFGELNQMGHTIVMITHDMHVAGHAGRVVKIVDGALCA